MIPSLRLSALLLLILFGLVVSPVLAQRPRPKPLVVDLIQNSLVTFPPGKTEVTVPLERGGNLLFVKVQINGQDAGFFLVDTGASTTLIDSDLAQRLKLPVIGNGNTTGVGGQQTAKAVSLDRINLGPAEAPVTLARHLALATDLADAKKSFGTGFGGLLGATLWGQQPFTLDYRARSLTFHRRAEFKPPPAARAEPIVFHLSHPAVHSVLNDNFMSLVELDTGHEYSLDIDHAFIVAHRELFDRAASLPGFAQGVGGVSPRWTTSLASLDIFGQRLKNLPVTFGRADLAQRVDPNVIEPFGETSSLGVLGGREMRNFRLTFDYLAAKLYTEPLPDDPLHDALGKPRDPNAPDMLGLPPLLVAIRNRDPETALALLAAGADPNLKFRDGTTPLQLARALNQTDIIAALQQKGAR